MALGEIALESDRYVEASLHLEAVLGRIDSLRKEDAVRVLSSYIDAYSRSVAARSPTELNGRDSNALSEGVADKHPKLVAAIGMLESLAAADIETRSRIGRVLFDCGDFEGSRSAYETLDQRPWEGTHTRHAR